MSANVSHESLIAAEHALGPDRLATKVSVSMRSRLLAPEPSSLYGSGALTAASVRMADRSRSEP